MGHYTNLTAAYLNEDGDYSYPYPETELFWRLEDLESRIEDLGSKNVCYGAILQFLMTYDLYCLSISVQYSKWKEL